MNPSQAVGYPKGVQDVLTVSDWRLSLRYLVDRTMGGVIVACAGLAVAVLLLILGYVVVGLFLATWAFSLVLWKTRRIEARWGRMIDRG